MPKVDDVLAESYLVRLWRDDRHSGWRASLQQVRTGQTHHFARPEALWTFLQAEMAGIDGRFDRPEPQPPHDDGAMENRRNVK